MGYPDSKMVPQISNQSAQRGIPSVLCVSYKKGVFSKILVHISEPEQEPIYSVSLSLGWYGRMLLHDGPDADSPVLAGSDIEGKWRTDFSIYLPPIPGLEISESQILRSKGNMKECYWFGMQIGQGAGRHIERFEWRRSHGTEVNSVEESKYGWKLVRLGHDAEEPDDDNPNKKPDWENEITNNGHEVVAV